MLKDPRWDSEPSLAGFALQAWYNSLEDETWEDFRNELVWYYNKRAEMWGAMKDWLKAGMIDNDPELIADLTAVEYGYAMRNGRDCILLEKKEHMKARGLSSPDDGDALALTFAHPVAKADQRWKYGAPGGGAQFTADYDPIKY